MNRRLLRVVIGYNRVKYRLRLVGEPCEMASQAALVQQSSFMRALADHPELLLCGPARFETLSIKHNGSAWEAEAVAEVEEDTEGR